MMPDELPIYDVDTAITALQAERAKRIFLEETIRDLKEEVAALKGMLCQCRTDRDIEIEA